MRLPAERYTRTAIALHWAVFFLIVCGFSLALYMTELKFSPLKLKLVAWHKWIGVSVFLLAVLRLFWRLTHRPPPLPVSMPAWQRTAAAVSHVTLYTLILIIPLSGWLMSSAFGVPTVYLGLVQLPNPIAADKALAEQLRSVHVYLNYTLLSLVILHVAAALKHHIVNRENVLSRMLPRISRRWRPWDRRDGQMPKSSPQRSTPPLQRLLLLAWLAAVAVIPYAAAQTVLYDKSRLSVVSRQMNVPVEAPFKKFSAQIDFDPLKPDAGRARIEVEVGSFDIGDVEVNEDVKSKTWFDAKTHPKAVFVTSSVRALGGGRFEARGPLTIKGKTLEVVALFTYKDEASMAVYEGHFPIKRLQYNIGEGVWKDTDTVADEVLIKFRLVIAKATVAGKK